ncbi:hypothetical protein GCM10009677_35220 [Sphaerisporangium rubeum]|nr:choice-of-anchor K domain-containing protein [Sphaerisporangium rubeum]
MGTVVTSGIWSRVGLDDVSLFAGIGTEHIRWGDVPDDKRSGYIFEGTVVEAQLDGSDFLLGTFTHQNRVIPMPTSEQFWVYLTVNVAFEDEGIEHDFTVRFRHDETPNEGPHPNDVVKLPKVHENEIVYVDNVEYKVSITGFLRNKRKVTQFDSPEGGSNSAGIFARFERSGSPSIS